VYFATWEQDLIVAQMGLAGRRKIPAPYVHIATLLGQKEAKGRTNVHVKDWYRNYLKRLSKTEEFEEQMKGSGTPPGPL
jgi:hypothetical protein